MAWEWQLPSGPAALINGAGMATNGDISTWTHGTGLGSDYYMWLNNPDYPANYGTAPFSSGDWVLVNLDSTYNLSKIWLWQYNCGNAARDLKHFRVYGSLADDAGNEGTGPQQTYFEIGGGQQTLAQTPGDAEELGQAFDLSGANGIKSVLIWVQDNYGDYYTGLSEVRFEVEVVSTLSIDNSGGATSINGSNGTAYLFGNLTSTGGASTTARIYWGDNDGGTNWGSWDTNASVGVRNVGLFSNQVSGLAADRAYYYRCYATNAGGDAWAPTTAVWMAQTRNVSSWHLVSVPMDVGAGSNRLNSTLGTNLMTGMQSGGSDTTSDNIWYLAPGGTAWWRNWYAAGGWQTGAARSALEIKVGEAFWVKRYSSGAAVDYTTFTGTKPANSATITLLSSNWVTFGWPYEEAGTTNGAGTTNAGWGFAERGGVRGYGARQADKIYAKYGGKWYELYLGINSNWYDGVSGQQTTIKLQPGGGYYYFHRGSTAKTWQAPGY